MPSAPLPLAEAALGDIIQLPPHGRHHTVRGSVRLPVVVGSVAGFIVAGEMDVLVTTPPTYDAPVAIYVPTPKMPASPDHFRSIAEGVFNYWAPHLPAVASAMGELAYRLLALRGSIDPVIVLYRDDEPIIFVRSSLAAIGELRVMALARTFDDTAQVTRYAASVRAPDAPAALPGGPAALYEAFSPRS